MHSRGPESSEQAALVLLSRLPHDTGARGQSGRTTWFAAAHTCTHTPPPPGIWEQTPIILCRRFVHVVGHGNFAVVDLALRLASHWLFRSVSLRRYGSCFLLGLPVSVSRNTEVSGADAGAVRSSNTAFLAPAVCRHT